MKIFQILKRNGGFCQGVANLYAHIGIPFTESEYKTWLANQESIIPGDKVIVTTRRRFSPDELCEYLGQISTHYILRKGPSQEAELYSKDDYYIEKPVEVVYKQAPKPGDRCIVVYEVGGKNKSWSGTYTFVAETPAAFIVKSNSDGKELTVNKCDHWLEKY